MASQESDDEMQSGSDQLLIDTSSSDDDDDVDLDDSTEDEAEGPVEEVDGEEDNEDDDDEEDEEWDSDDNDEGEEEGDEAAAAGPSQAAISDSSDSGDPDCDRCPICLARLRDQFMGTPESCDHSFCLECIQEWAKNVNTCPVDRQPFNLIFVRDSLDGVVVKRIEVSNRRLELEEEVVEDLTYCEVCGHANREDRLLLCDGCDLGYHCECLDPALDSVPVGEWFCPNCSAMERQQHEMSIRPTQAQRRIGRTIVSERVRATIQQNRAQAQRSGGSHSQSTSARSGPGTIRRRRKKIKRRKQKRKVTPKGKGKMSAMTSSTGKKRTKRRRRKKRKTRKMCRTKDSVAPKTVKSRLAGRLGITTPPVGRTLPVKVSARSKALTIQRDIGIAPLTIMAGRDDLDPAWSDNDMPATPHGGDNGNGTVTLQVPSRYVSSSKYTKAARSSWRPIPLGRKLERQIECTEPFDLLGDILASQDRLNTNIKRVKIHRDGSLEVKQPEKKALPSFRNHTQECQPNDAETTPTSGDQQTPVNSSNDTPHAAHNAQETQEATQQPSSHVGCSDGGGGDASPHGSEPHSGGCYAEPDCVTAVAEVKFSDSRKDKLKMSAEKSVDKSDDRTECDKHNSEDSCNSCEGYIDDDMTIDGDASVMAIDTDTPVNVDGDTPMTVDSVTPMTGDRITPMTIDSDTRLNVDSVTQQNVDSDTRLNVDSDIAINVDTTAYVTSSDESCVSNDGDNQQQSEKELEECQGNEDSAPTNIHLVCEDISSGSESVEGTGHNLSQIVSDVTDEESVKGSEKCDAENDIGAGQEASRVTGEEVCELQSCIEEENEHGITAENSCGINLSGDEGSVHNVSGDSVPELHSSCDEGSDPEAMGDSTHKVCDSKNKAGNDDVCKLHVEEGSDVTDGNVHENDEEGSDEVRELHVDEGSDVTGGDVHENNEEGSDDVHELHVDEGSDVTGGDVHENIDEGSDDVRELHVDEGKDVTGGDVHENNEEGSDDVHELHVDEGSNVTGGDVHENNEEGSDHYVGEENHEEGIKEEEVEGSVGSEERTEALLSDDADLSEKGEQEVEEEAHYENISEVDTGGGSDDEGICEDSGREGQGSASMSHIMVPISELPRIPKKRKTQEVLQPTDGESPHSGVLERLNRPDKVDRYPKWEPRGRKDSGGKSKLKQSDSGGSDDVSQEKLRDDRSERRDEDTRRRHRNRSRSSSKERLHHHSKSSKHRHSHRRSRTPERERSRKRHDRSHERNRDTSRVNARSRSRSPHRRDDSRSKRDRYERPVKSRQKSDSSEYKGSVNMFSRSLKDVGNDADFGNRRFKLRRNSYKDFIPSEIVELSKRPSNEKIETYEEKYRPRSRKNVYIEDNRIKVKTSMDDIHDDSSSSSPDVIIIESDTETTSKSRLEKMTSDKPKVKSNVEKAATGKTISDKPKVKSSVEQTLCTSSKPTEDTTKHSRSPHRTTSQGRQTNSRSPSKVAREGQQARSRSPSGAPSQGQQTNSRSPSRMTGERRKTHTESPNRVLSKERQNYSRSSPSRVHDEGKQTRSLSPRRVASEGRLGLTDSTDSCYDPCHPTDSVSPSPPEDPLEVTEVNMAGVAFSSANDGQGDLMHPGLRMQTPMMTVDPRTMPPPMPGMPGGLIIPTPPPHMTFSMLGPRPPFLVNNHLMGLEQFTQRFPQPRLSWQPMQLMQPTRHLVTRNGVPLQPPSHTGAETFTMEATAMLSLQHGLPPRDDVGGMYRPPLPPMPAVNSSCTSVPSLINSHFSTSVLSNFMSSMKTSRRSPGREGNTFKVPFPPNHPRVAFSMSSDNHTDTKQVGSESNEVVDMDVSSPLSDDLLESFTPPLFQDDDDNAKGVRREKGSGGKGKEEVPGSAVELDKQEKYLKKLNRQERVVEEVKLAIKPFYAKGQISKDEYKDIMRKTVPKICHSKSGNINPVKIRSYVQAYVEKVQQLRKYKQKKQHDDVNGHKRRHTSCK